MQSPRAVAALVAMVLVGMMLTGAPIAAHADSLFISAITGFEIALKQAKGRLVLPLPAEPWLERALVQHSVGEIPVTWRIAARSENPPRNQAYS